MPQEDTAKLNILSRINKYLLHEGFHFDMEHVVIHEVPTQFLPAYNPLIVEAVNRGEKITFHGIKTKTVLPEYSIAIALQTNCPKDKAHLLMLFGQAKINAARLKDILKRHKLYDKYKEFLKKHS